MKTLATLAIVAVAASAHAEIKIGVTVSATGPAASLGIVEQNVFDLLPSSVAGEPVTFIILDDRSDPTRAVQNARKLTSEYNVDALIGSTTTPGCLAVTQIAAETGTPLLAMGAGASIVEPMDDKRRWVFKPVHNDAMMVRAIVEHMVKTGVKSIGYLGFSDATGEGYLKTLEPLAKKDGIKLVDVERYARTDSSVTGQVLRLLAAKPDAIFIAAFGTPAALPQLTLAKDGYEGRIYQTHGVANNDFLRVAGKSAEGTFLPVGPLLVADQLQADHPAKAKAVDIVKRYEAKYGAGSRNTFISNAYDSWLLIAHAIPVALKKGKPGTQQFRSALRDAIEATKDFAGTQGVYNMSETDHVGLDRRSRAMVQINNGHWKVTE
jgi:branched-chain amino acid transport system substrate-binding protein